MLNEDGGIEADLTTVCLGKNNFRIITGAANREHDKFHIEKHLSEDVKLLDITDDYCVLGVFGPKSRNLMKDLSNDDYSNENFKFGTAKYITINNNQIWTQRLSYVGELGYELYIEKNKAKEIYNLILDKGKKYQLSHCGMHAMDIMRMESGFLHWGHDISPEENQYEAGLNFTISYKKNVDFIGKKKLLEAKDKKQIKKFIMLTLKNSRPGEPLILHDEPIYLDGRIIGRTTSGNYSFNFNKNLAFGYIKVDGDINSLKNKTIEIEIEKKKYKADILINSLNQKNYKNL
tara:strand:+ start:18 stop:887 length:870 start_codon:yes stop_codon:yes gene_type:complete